MKWLKSRLLVLNLITSGVVLTSDHHLDRGRNRPNIDFSFVVMPIIISLKLGRGAGTLPSQTEIFCYNATLARPIVQLGEAG